MNDNFKTIFVSVPFIHAPPPFFHVTKPLRMRFPVSRLPIDWNAIQKSRKPVAFRRVICYYYYAYEVLI